MQKFKTFTENQKKEIVAICKEISSKSEQSRHEGILSLEENIEDLLTEYPTKNGKFFFSLLRMVVDGIDGTIISEIADNYFESSAENDFEKLMFRLIKTGVLSIQSGENPYVIQRKLLSFVGFDDEADFCAKTGFAKWGEYYGW